MMEEKKCCCHTDVSMDAGQVENPTCDCRKRVRNAEEYRKLTNRLSRVEGQIRGIRKMLQEDAYCPDILTQAAAATAALNAFSRELLSEHIRTCVKADIQEGRDESIDELLDTLRKMMR